MGNNLVELKWKRDQLWRGCLIASIAHAIMVAHYPELSNEQSWDGINYSVQDSKGSRGTVTFHSEYVVAAFRNDNSDRITATSKIQEANEYFKGAPNNIFKLAETEALQYLLDYVSEKTIPLITTAFWGTGNEIFSSDTFDEMLQNGGNLLVRQALDIDEAIEAWEDYYGMTKKQRDLLESIFRRKVVQLSDKLVLSKDEIAMIGTDDEDGLDESRTSFSEIGIAWEE